VGRGGKKRFCLVLVKPSHYDDDGYVIQWLRSPIPSTSLAALYGLAQDCAERRVLGPDVEIDVHAFDETNTRIRCDRLAAMICVAGAGMVMLVGVQSNQFPRALDLAKALRERDIPVAMGGFHVSGTLSMHHVWDRCGVGAGVRYKIVLRSLSPVRAVSNGDCGCSGDSACRMHLRWDAGLNGKLRQHR
jgi:hypothetical protein